MLLLEFTMTGTKHSQAYNLHKQDIKKEDMLGLELDRGNQFDENAMKVLWQGEHIGWVPKKLGEAKNMLARLMDHFTISAQVYEHEPDNPTDMQLIVRVELLEHLE